MVKPRILFFLSRFLGFGGIERVTQTLVRHLQTRGYVVAVCAFCRPPPDAGSHCPGVEVVYEPHPDPGNSANDGFFRNLVTRFRADVVVFQDCYHAMERHLIGLPPHVKLVVVEHNTPTIPIRLPGAGGPLAALVRFPSWLRFAKAALWTKRRHRFLYGISDRYVLLSDRYFGELRWVACLDDSRKLRAIPNVNTFEAVRTVPEKCREVLFLGSLLRVKGVDFLLDAWNRIAEGRGDWTLRIVGDGPLRGELETSVRKAKLPRVVFHGARKDVEPFLRQAAILAAPSRHEGFPMVLGEAMAHGTVPVCFDSYSALRDIVDDGVDGLIVPAFDVDAFAGALKRLMDDRPLREGMASRALASIGRFSAERVLPLWEALFSELQNGGTEPK